MIFSLSFPTLTNPRHKVSFWNPSSIFWTPYCLCLSFFFVVIVSLYSNSFFLNIHSFWMGNFNWLVRTKVIKRIIQLFIVKYLAGTVLEEEVFHIWFSKFWMWLMAEAHGSHCLFLNFRPQGFCLAVASTWNVLPPAFCGAGFFSLLKSTGMSFPQRSFPWDSFLKCLLSHLQALFILLLFYFLHMSASEVFTIWITLLTCILHGGSRLILLLILDPHVPRPRTVPGTQGHLINKYSLNDWLTEWWMTLKRSCLNCLRS